MKVLAIESTCDETAVAVVEQDENGSLQVLSEAVASSASLHQKYGGIVPEVAAREQVRAMIPVIREGLGNIKIAEIGAVAVSNGPGLMGSLLVGVETAKVLAYSWKKPLIKVNHMAAHVAANWINRVQRPVLPAIGLVVSGGHTDLIYLKDWQNWEWIGGTRDDAVGEAFDKVARILGLPYPGGPEIQKLVKEDTGEMEEKIKLPRPMIHENNLEMSFSGLKAAVSKEYEASNKSQRVVREIAIEFNRAVVEVLIKKTMMAMDQYKCESLVVAGGVAANEELRSALTQVVDKERLYFPELKYCGDNAAMVAAAAILRPNLIEIKDLKPEPGMETVD